MGFRKLRGVRLSWERQGYVYFTCQTFENQPKRTQEKICRLCNRHGGEYSDALFELLTTKRSVVAVAMKYNVSDRTLYRLRREFYEGWYGGGRVQGR